MMRTLFEKLGVGIFTLVFFPFYLDAIKTKRELVEKLIKNALKGRFLLAIAFYLATATTACR